MFYHASPARDITVLKPRASNHGTPLVYFSGRRENVLVYLSNAVEKYCRETGYVHTGVWHKWASYGFTKGGILQLDEYYPNAIADTYMGVSGFIYSVEALPGAEALADIPFAFTASRPVPVEHCEFIPDAYEEIMKSAEKGEILLRRYEAMPARSLEWIKSAVYKEYEESEGHEEYRYFLKAKFPFLGGN